MYCSTLAMLVKRYVAILRKPENANSLQDVNLFIKRHMVTPTDRPVVMQIGGPMAIALAIHVFVFTIVTTESVSMEINAGSSTSTKTTTCTMVVETAGQLGAQANMYDRPVNTWTKNQMAMYIQATRHSQQHGELVLEEQAKQRNTVYTQ